jgi:hypothetical protein
MNDHAFMCHNALSPALIPSLNDGMGIGRVLICNPEFGRSRGSSLLSADCNGSDPHCELRHIRCERSPSISASTTVRD